MKLNIKLENICNQRTDFCDRCESEFMKIRPYLKGVVISKHFIRDIKSQEEINSIIQEILDCSHLEFNELHKFEENIHGNLIFRAKRRNTHIVYAVDKNMNIIFMRAIKNFTEYKKFLEDKKGIRKMIGNFS